MEQPNLESISTVTDYIRKLADDEYYGTITLTFTKGVVVTAQLQQTFKSGTIQTQMRSKENNLRRQYDANNKQQR